MHDQIRDFDWSLQGYTMNAGVQTIAKGSRWDFAQNSAAKLQQKSGQKLAICIPANRNTPHLHTPITSNNFGRLLCNQVILYAFCRLVQAEKKYVNSLRDCPTGDASACSRGRVRGTPAPLRRTSKGSFSAERYSTQRPVAIEDGSRQNIFVGSLTSLFCGAGRPRTFLDTSPRAEMTCPSARSPLLIATWSVCLWALTSRRGGLVFFLVYLSFDVCKMFQMFLELLRIFL